MASCIKEFGDDLENFVELGEVLSIKVMNGCGNSV